MRNQLSIEQLERKAPAIFATEAFEGMSDQYRFVPTTDILYGLMDNGFVPVDANQTNTRKFAAEQFARHVIRFQHKDFSENEKGDIPELVLLNSHNGTSSYQLMLGIFRMVCSNGMIVQSESIQKTRVLHRGPEHMVNDVIEGSFEVVKEAPKVIEQIEEWKNIELEPFEREAYAEAAFSLRGSKIEVPVQQILGINRSADAGNDVWKTMNTVQENAIRGKCRGFDDKNRVRKVQGIKSVDADTKFNKALWLLTEKLVEGKKSGDYTSLLH